MRPRTIVLALAGLVLAATLVAAAPGGGLPGSVNTPFTAHLTAVCATAT